MVSPTPSAGEPRIARNYHKRELKVARKVGDRRMEAHALNGLGFDSADLHEYQRAIEHYKKALEIFGKVGDPKGKGYALGNLGLAYMELGDPGKAIEYHSQALGIDLQIGYRRGEAEDLGGLGSAYTASGDPRQAIEYHNQALAIDRELGDRIGEAGDLSGLGDAMRPRATSRTSKPLLNTTTGRSILTANGEIEDLKARIAGNQPRRSTMRVITHRPWRRPKLRSESSRKINFLTPKSEVNWLTGGSKGSGYRACA